MAHRISVCTKTNSHLRSLLQVKSLLNYTEDCVLSSCIQTLFEIFGCQKSILDILIKCSTETQLNTMKDIIEKAIAVTNKVGTTKNIQHNFAQISDVSISNIISFLSKDDMKQFKLTSMRISILCLERMDTTSTINNIHSKPTYNKSPTTSSSFISKTNERCLLIQQWNTHANNISLKKQSYIIQASAEKCDSISIKQCGCAERLRIIFSYVNRWNLDDIDSILHIFGHLNQYSVQDFVNDLDHIRRYHDTLVNQQAFCKQINYCDRTKCNFQDRSCMIKTVEHSVFNNEIAEETFAHFQFIQEAHLYLFHSLPMTYDNTCRDEMQRLIKEYNAFNKHRSSRFVDKHDHGGNSSPTASHSPKTSTTVEMVEMVETAITDDCIEDELEYKEDQTVTDLEKVTSPLFSYGSRFEYNPHRNTKKNPYYVGCAYENLKKELLDDPDKNYTIKQWNALIHISSTLLELPFSKTLKTIDGKCISKGRILAVRLYCSEGSLASALKKTYRESKTLTKVQQKKLHSKFAHWGRLLLTTCDLFGVNMTQNHNCYRGLNDVYIFKSGFSSKLFGPISTTRQIAVAAAFAGNGIILKIEKASFCKTARFFECNPYSNYKSEHELLFDGHNNYLDVTAIYDIIEGVVSTNPYDAKPVLLLQALTSKCSIDVGTLIRLSPYITKKLCKLLRKYKENENEYKIKNDYILETISYYLNHLKKLDMKVQQIEDLIKICNELNQMDVCQELLSYLICNVDSLMNKQLFEVDFFELIKVIPNTKSLSFDMSHCNVELGSNINGKWWNGLIQYMLKTKRNSGTNSKNKFKRIEFKKLTKQKFPLKLLKQVKGKINGCKWDIYFANDTKSDDIKSILFLYGKNENDKANNWIKL